VSEYPVCVAIVASRERLVSGSGISHPHLTEPPCALLDKAQAARMRYRSGIGQSAEGITLPSALAPLPSVSAPFPQPLHAVALHGFAKKHGSIIKRLPFAGS
jgi:hypothetical protein